jgi:predicted acyltransferase
MTTLTAPSSISTEIPSRAAPSAPQRLASVDALRGFDMFWIMGAGALAAALRRFKPSAPTNFLADQLEHVEWEGFRFYDLIFPLFIFLAGVSLVFSLSRTIEMAGRAEALKRVFRRGILLFIIGIIYSGGFSRFWPDMRLMGVLNRIGLAYLFAGLFFCFFKPKGLIAICASLLVGYWALMTFVPIRDIQLTKRSMIQVAEARGDTDAAALLRDSGNVSTNKEAWAASERLFYNTTDYTGGKFGKGYNVADHFDFKYLPGKKYDHFFDPEGIVSTIPAIATCLLGVFAGFLLKNQTVEGKRKVIYLLSAGVIAAVLGWCWNLQFPVVKKIWTSSYVLVAGGYSAILLALFYWVVDVLEIRGWCQPFIWMGMNSITVYLASNFMGGDGWLKLGTRLAGGDIRSFLDRHIGRGMGDMTIALVGLAIAFWLCHFLYKRKIFLRL